MQSTTSVAAVGLYLTGALLRSLIIVYIHQMIIFGIRKWIIIYGVVMMNRIVIAIIQNSGIVASQISKCNKLKE